MLLARASASCRHVVRLIGVSVLSILSVGSGGPATAGAEGSPRLLALVMPVYPRNLTKHIQEQPGMLGIQRPPSTVCSLNASYGTLFCLSQPTHSQKRTHRGQIRDILLAYLEFKMAWCWARHIAGLTRRRSGDIPSFVPDWAHRSPSHHSPSHTHTTLSGRQLFAGYHAVCICCVLIV